jgi:glycosyltransferase 2 family protein
VQAASQVNMASAAGLPLGTVAVAFPIAALSSIVAGLVLGAGLALNQDLTWSLRVIALCGLGSPCVLYRPVLARALGVARRIVRRIPTADRLPSQHSINSCFGWALANVGTLCGAFTVLLMSLNEDASALAAFCAFAVAWVIGFVIVPIPAGVGVREAVLLGLVPGVTSGLLLAASLALRLISIAVELLAIGGNRLAIRWHLGREATAAPVEPAGTVPVPPIADAPAIIPGRSDVSADEAAGHGQTGQRGVSEPSG